MHPDDRVTGPHRKIPGGVPGPTTPGPAPTHIPTVGGVPDLGALRAQQLMAEAEQRAAREQAEGRHPSHQPQAVTIEQVLTALMNNQQALGNGIGEVLRLMHALGMGRPHVAVVADSGLPGVWRVACLACSEESGTYTYPCQQIPEGPEGDQVRSAWPPSTLMEVQESSEAASTSD